MLSANIIIIELIIQDTVIVERSYYPFFSILVFKMWLVLLHVHLTRIIILHNFDMGEIILITTSEASISIILVNYNLLFQKIYQKRHYT